MDLGHFHAEGSHSHPSNVLFNPGWGVFFMIRTLVHGRDGQRITLVRFSYPSALMFLMTGVRLLLLSRYSI